MDTTGVRVHRAGGRVERRHGKKKRYVKAHFAVNVQTREIVAMEVTIDNTHDSKVFPKLLERLRGMGKSCRSMETAHTTAQKSTNP